MEKKIGYFVVLHVQRYMYRIALGEDGRVPIFESMSDAQAHIRLFGNDITEDLVRPIWVDEGVTNPTLNEFLWYAEQCDTESLIVAPLCNLILPSYAKAQPPASAPSAVLMSGRNIRVRK